MEMPVVMQLSAGIWELTLSFTRGETEAGRREVTHEGPHSQAKLGQGWDQDPGLSAPHPPSLSASRHRGANSTMPEPRRPPVGGMGRKASRRRRSFWQEQAGTPWDLTLTCNSWFPGRIVLGRAAQPTAKALIFIANKGQAQPRKRCRFLRHAVSSSLGGRSLRSPEASA